MMLRQPTRSVLTSWKSRKHSDSDQVFLGKCLYALFAVRILNPVLNKRKPRRGKKRLENQEEYQFFFLENIVSFTEAL